MGEYPRLTAIGLEPYATIVGDKLTNAGLPVGFRASPQSTQFFVGDLEIRGRVSTDRLTWDITGGLPGAQVIIARERSGDPNRTWRLAQTYQGYIAFTFFLAAGTQSGSLVVGNSAWGTLASWGVVAGEDFWFRMRFDVDNGASGRTGYLSISRDGVTWPAELVSVAAGTGPAWPTNTEPVQVGQRLGSAEQWNGRIYWVDVYNGWVDTGGTHVIHFSAADWQDPSPNLLYPEQASGENALGWAGPLNCTVADSTLFALDGTHSVEITANGVGTARVNNTPAVTYGVVPGLTYTVAAWIYAPSAARNAYVFVDWITSSGTFISSMSAGSVVLTAASWKLVYASGVADVNANRFTVNINVQAPLNGEKFYWDKLMVREGLSTAYAAPLASVTGETWLRQAIKSEIWKNYVEFAYDSRTAEVTQAGAYLQLEGETAPRDFRGPTSHRVWSITAMFNRFGGADAAKLEELFTLAHEAVDHRFVLLPGSRVQDELVSSQVVTIQGWSLQPQKVSGIKAISFQAREVMA